MNTPFSIQKKVLVLAYYFPPMGLSGVQRTLKFTKYLRRFHWEPTVITTGPVGYYALDKSLQAELEATGIRVLRTSGGDVNAMLAGNGDYKQRAMPPEFLRKTLSRISSFFFVPDNKRSWATQAFKAASALMQEEQFDLIFVSGPPFSAMQAGARLKKKFGVPLVVDYRDLWYGNQFTTDPTPLHSFLNHKMEYNMLTAADKIVVTNRNMKARMLEHHPFLSYDDISIISQGYDPEDMLLPAAPRPNWKFRLGYAGMFYDFITPKFFLKAFQQIVQEQPQLAADMELHFLGLFRKENTRLVKKLGLESYVHQYGYLDHKNAVSMLQSFDALWMMAGKTRNVDTHSSGKLYEYFGTKKPLIVSVPEGALTQAARKYGAAIVTEADNIFQIKLAILQLYQQHKNRETMRPNIEFVEQHRRDYLTEQLSKEFNFALDHP
ncbi:MAG: glycosyl transferase family 1 [Candidatus Kapaibacterium sp.]|nr:MAG: glycosyl transferase family 1 [Candidatus Kapabacteria bacterium]